MGGTIVAPSIHADKDKIKMISEKSRNQLVEDVLLSFGGQTIENLTHGFRVKKRTGQVAAIYWSNIYDGNDIEIAICPRQVTDVCEADVVQKWLEHEKAKSGRKCNIHKGDSDWPIIGFAQADLSGFLGRYSRFRLGGLSQEDKSSMALTQETTNSSDPEENVNYVEMFKRALLQLKPKITDGQMKMLVGHYVAPDMTLSVLKLAELAGYNGSSPGKLHYGKLARAISECSGLAPASSDQISTIAEWTTDKDENGHGQWIMYAEFATALEELGWVDTITDSGMEADLPDIDAILFAKEGQSYWALHLRRERNQQIVDAKKKQVLLENRVLACEACGFDFGNKYGVLGDDFCEVHHKNPLAAAGDGVRTELADLAIVCSNCHRMLHRNSNTLSVDTLRILVEENQG